MGLKSPCFSLAPVCLYTGKTAAFMRRKPRFFDGLTSAGGAMPVPYPFSNGRFAPVNTFVSGFCLPGAPRAAEKRPGQLLAPQWKGKTAACFGSFQTNSKNFFKKRKKPPISYFGRTTKSLPPCYTVFVTLCLICENRRRAFKNSVQGEDKEGNFNKNKLSRPLFYGCFPRPAAKNRPQSRRRVFGAGGLCV